MARRPGMLGVLALAALTLPAARGDDAAGVEFFEKEVRPILVGRCQECHGPEEQKSGLRLDSRAAALAGGLTGPAVVPGNLDESLLVDVINYGDLYQMPPKSKLPDAEIATLTRWVAMGAPWPEAAARGAAPPGVEAFDLDEREEHWSFQPISDPEPPAVQDASWPLNPIDRFLLARLESEGLHPVPDADRRTLLRRLSFDLIGLPPTPDQIDEFLYDDAPDAYERLVDRLLASPHHGERWGRHWLDLVRFAETCGHEFDYDILGAWRYRDYVIRAFNADVPYDQFVVEHLAGDLLDEPRRDPCDGSNESVLGTAVFRLGEGTHSPVDLREEQARRVDNQIDVVSKTFLALTVACARCHDHKFDAITTKDYYALFGSLKSSRYQEAFLDPPDRITAKAEALAGLREEIRGGLGADASGIAEVLLAARRSLRGETTTGDGPDPATLDRWLRVLGDPKSAGVDSPLFAWLATVDAPPDDFAAQRDAALERLRDPAERLTDIALEDFDGPDFRGWSATGDAFGAGPSGPGSLRLSVGVEEITPEVVPPGSAHSGLVSDRLQGDLRSPTFLIDRKYLHYRAGGTGGRISLVIDGFEKIRSPIYGGLTFPIRDEGLRWYVQDVSMWTGHEAYIEVADGAAAEFTGGQTAYVPGDGFVMLDEVRASDDATPPAAVDRLSLALLSDPAIGSAEALAERFETEIAGAIDDWKQGRPDADGRAPALAWLVDRGLLPLDGADANLLASYREREAAIPAPTLGPALVDGTGADEPVHIRGNPKTLGEVVPRRFLEALGGLDGPSIARGSGRLELARRLVDPGNPLTARVMVNRIWKGHFGVGLVPTPDDFGHMGQPPSHPELLDWLAQEFMRQGWSIKAMHRLIVTSHAYRMQAAAGPDAEEADPTNALLHRQNVRRLEAEALRDAMLAVSGRLDHTPFGPSVPPHLTPFMEGRGRPRASGPLDGDGRRSIYINVRRNFLTPMFLAFDFPQPTTTIGRRNVSNVPAQALTLLNDPFVLGQARLWAERVLAAPADSAGDRVAAMYLSAFGRPPTDDERGAALDFLRDREDDAAAWAELAHVLFNTKEFLFIR